MNQIKRVLIKESDRVTHTANLFGFHFPIHLEPLIYATADSLSADYQGGYWDFYSLSNGGFYMSPAEATVFHVTCENGFEGDLSADVFGITACLYAYSRLSFSGIFIADVCAQQYHWLREYALEHAEVEGIMAAVD
jgi:hypothetical protein